MRNYKSTMIRDDILEKLLKIARFRGMSLQELLVELIDSYIEEEMLDEIGK